MWLVAAAFAAPPDRDVALLGNVTDIVDHLSVSPDGSIVAGVTSERAFIASTDAWTATTDAPCNVNAVAAVNDAVWAGCGNGKILRVPVTDAGPGVADAAITVSDDPVVGLFVHNETVWVLTQATGTGVSTVTLTPMDLATSAADATAAVALPYPGYSDAVVVGEFLYVVHGTDEVTRVPLAGGTSTVSLQRIGVSPSDVCPSPNDSIYGVATGGLYEYDPQYLRWTLKMSLTGTPTAVAASKTGGWVAVVNDSTADLWLVSDHLDGTTPDDSFDVGPGVLDIVADDDGYAYAAGVGVSVWTSNPWVAAGSTTPTTALTGDVVTVPFVLDRTADWAIYVGGDRTGSGTRLASGHSAAGSVEASVTVDHHFIEGDNRLYVLATANGATGHDRTIAHVDNPPGAPTLAEGNLSWSDGALILAFDGIPDADLARYDVYVTTTPFDGADWPTGGPAFDGVDAISTPIALATAGGDAVSYRIAPLTNGTTYYVAVRAIDQGGLMGPMSDVISNSPRPSYSSAELAGDVGGPLCATGPGASFGAAALAGLVALARRRRVVAALAVGLAASTTALAQDTEGEVRASDAARPRRDLTLTHGDFELRYGGIQLIDTNITDVYGTTGNQVLQMEFGVQPFNALASGHRTRLIAQGQKFTHVPDPLGFFEIDGGIGFFQELAFLVAAGTTTPSGDHTMLTMWPFSLDGTVRAQLVDEQLLVPFARMGGDYVLWDERWDNGSGGKDKVNGAKTGYHYGAGLEILLDGLSPARASLLEAQSGINDTYLVVEWRKQFISKAVGTDATGLDFSGTMVTAGIKLDF